MRSPLPRRRPRPALGLAGMLGALVAAVAAVVAVPTPATAVPPSAVADGYTVYAGGTYTLTPIANDEKGFLNFADLALCGVSAFDQGILYLEQVDNTIVIEVNRGFRGSTTIDYQVCQGNESDTGTITLTVDKVGELKAAKQKGVAGKVVFTNGNSVPVQVTYGSASSGKPDATKTVPANGTITIATKRASIYWVGVYVADDLRVIAGDATIKSVQSRR